MVKISQNHDFFTFHKIWSRGHIMTSKVSGSILGVSRTLSGPYITISDTSGQMRHHHMRSQKYPKMPKIAIFDQKSWFFQSGYQCSYDRYMAGNMHLGCLRPILSAFTISGVLLVHFSKIRKKSIFWLFFGDFLLYIYTYMQLWMQKCEIKRKIAFFMVWTLPKKFLSR